MSIRTFRLTADSTKPAIGQEIDVLVIPLSLLRSSGELIAAEVGGVLRDAAVVFTGTEIALEVIMAEGEPIVRPIAKSVYKGKRYISLTNLTNADKEG